MLAGDLLDHLQIKEPFRCLFDPCPEGIDAEQLRKAVKDRFDILLAGGQDHLKGQVFRIGHLGFVCDRDVLTAVAAIESTLQSLGLHKTSMGAGVAATAAALAG